jgi:hypothetical protein
MAALGRVRNGKVFGTGGVDDRAVIDDVDAYLLALLRQSITEEEAAVRFEPPTAEWARSISGPCIDLFCHDVAEELDGRFADWTDVRDGTGRVTARQPPVRRYCLSYLTSAWAPSTEIEHRLLSKVLRAVVEADTFPLPAASFGDDADLVEVAVAQGSPAHEVWSQLKTEPKTSFRLTVKAPLRPSPVTEIAPPAESLSLDVGGPDRQAVEARTAAPPDPASDKKWTAFRPREPGTVPAPEPAPAGKARKERPASGR